MVVYANAVKHWQRIPPRHKPEWKGRLCGTELLFSSQNGEDGIIQAILSRMGSGSKFFVEFGCGDGRQCNTRYLAQFCGWHGLMMDADEANIGAASRRYGSAGRIVCKRERLTAENVEELFDRYGVPEKFDLLSIDVDGNDYWIWRAIQRHRARVIVIEFNAQLPPEECKVIPYDPAYRWDETSYFGASLGALVTLAHEKGYVLVETDSRGVNAFFVDKGEAVRHGIAALSPRAAYHAPRFGVTGAGHPFRPGAWVDV